MNRSGSDGGPKRKLDATLNLNMAGIIQPKPQIYRCTELALAGFGKAGQPQQIHLAYAGALVFNVQMPLQLICIVRCEVMIKPFSY